MHYAEKPYIKKLLLERLTRHGNVRYVFSGHVHIPLKASVKTAVNHREIRFINLPAGGYRPRAFGEEDYFGGPCQGVALVKVTGKDVRVDYLDVARNVFTYPSEFREAPLQQRSLLTRNKWELATGNVLQNGHFTNLEGWHGHYVYQEDDSPTYLRDIREVDEVRALYLSARRRRYPKPGQDRLPQTLNQLTQVMLTPDGRLPQVNLRIKLSCPEYFEEALTGVFIWIEAYHGYRKQYSVIYSAGKVPASLSNRFDHADELIVVHRHLPAVSDRWHTLLLNPTVDLDPVDRPVDRWALNLGVWNINDGNNQGIEAYFAAVEQQAAGREPSQLDGVQLSDKPENMRYTFRVNHTAGEHVIANQAELYFPPPLR